VLLAAVASKHSSGDAESRDGMAKSRQMPRRFDDHTGFAREPWDNQLAESAGTATRTGRSDPVGRPTATLVELIANGSRAEPCCGHSKRRGHLTTLRHTVTRFRITLECFEATPQKHDQSLPALGEAKMAARAFKNYPLPARRPKIARS